MTCACRPGECVGLGLVVPGARCRREVARDLRDRPDRGWTESGVTTRIDGDEIVLAAPEGARLSADAAMSLAIALTGRARELTIRAASQESGWPA